MAWLKYLKYLKYPCASRSTTAVLRPHWRAVPRGQQPFRPQPATARACQAVYEQFKDGSGGLGREVCVLHLPDSLCMLSSFLQAHVRFARDGRQQLVNRFCVQIIEIMRVNCLSGIIGRLSASS